MKVVLRGKRERGKTTMTPRGPSAARRKGEAQGSLVTCKWALGSTPKPREKRPKKRTLRIANAGGEREHTEKCESAIRVEPEGNKAIKEGTDALKAQRQRCGKPSHEEVNIEKVWYYRSGEGGGAGQASWGKSRS